MLQNYAIIDGINVINIIQYEEQPSNPPAGFESPIIAVQSDTAGIGWTYVDGVFIAPYIPPPTPEELISQCKQTSKVLLQASDWATLSDVILTNKEEFLTYRATLRNLVLNPVTSPEFPSEPTPIWSN